MPRLFANYTFLQGSIVVCGRISRNDLRELPGRRVLSEVKRTLIEFLELPAILPIKHPVGDMTSLSSSGSTGANPPSGGKRRKRRKDTSFICQQDRRR